MMPQDLRGRWPCCVLAPECQYQVSALQGLIKVACQICFSHRWNVQLERESCSKWATIIILGLKLKELLDLGTLKTTVDLKYIFFSSAVEQTPM